MTEEDEEEAPGRRDVDDHSPASRPARRRSRRGASARKLGQRAARFGIGWAFDALRFPPGMLFAGVGAALLSTAWLAGPERIVLAHRLERFTARAEGVASRPFWRFDVDLDRLGGGWNWPATTTAELCADVDFPAPAAGKVHSTLCGARRSRSAPWGILDTQGWPAEAPLPWPRDGHGMPEVELRLSPRALAWLAGRPAGFWPLTGQSEEARSAMPPSGTELDAFLLEVDRPVEWLVRTWSTPGTRAPIAMAFDPDDPNDALPVSDLDAVHAAGPSWGMTVALGAFGLVFWVAGIGYAFAGSAPWLLALVTVGPLVALPWWGASLEPALLWLEPRAGEVGADMARSLTEPLRFPVERREPGELAGLQSVTWSLARSYYDTLAGRFAPSFPDPAPHDPDNALATAAAEVAERMAAASDDELLPLLARLRQDELVDRGEAGILFLAGARRAALDEARSPAVRQTAASFLWWLSVTPIEPDPKGPAFQTRLTLWKSLLDFPDPAVANQAASLVERATAEHH